MLIFHLYHSSALYSYKTFDNSSLYHILSLNKYTFFNQCSLMLKKGKNLVCPSPAWNSAAVCFPNSCHCPLFSPFNQNSFKCLPSHTSPIKPFVFYIHSCSLSPCVREKAFFQSSSLEILTDIKQIELFEQSTSAILFFSNILTAFITLFSQFILVWQHL